MFYRLFFLFATVSLFAQTPPSSVATTISPVPSTLSALFLIDPMQRGQDLYNLFTTLTTPGSVYVTTNNSAAIASQVALQTTRNGLITNIAGIVPAKNYTLFIVSYYQTRNFLQYIVVPVEQIIELVYSYTAVTSNQGTYASNFTTGIMPYYNVNILERALDIIDVFTKLTAKGSVYYNNGRSQVGLQTTLTGPYYALPSSANGLISNVQSISLNGSAYGTVLLISYQVLNNQKTQYYIVVPTDQIYGINYYYYVSP